MYFLVKNNKIIGYQELPVLDTDIIMITATKLQNKNVEKYGFYFYIYQNDKIIENPDYYANKLKQAKYDKLQEALDKANYFQQNGTVSYKNCEFEMSDSNRKNLTDTEDALIELGQESTQWNDKNDNIVTLTTKDIRYIRLNLILAKIQKLWIVDYPNYKMAIEQAKTIDELQEIEISYE